MRKTITFLLSETLLFFFWTKTYFIVGDIFFKYSQRFNYLSFFFAEVDTKKHRYSSTKASNAALVKLTDWIIKNDHVINCAMFLCKWVKYGQTINDIWLSTTWLLNVLQLQNFVYTQPQAATQGKWCLLMHHKSKETGS